MREIGAGAAGEPPGNITSFSGRTMILIAGLGVFLAGPAQTYGVAVFINPILEEFGWSRSVISSAYAFGTLAGAGGVVLTGRLLDRFGHRRVFAVSALGFGGALIAMSLTTDPWTLALGFALVRGFGIGAAGRSASWPSVARSALRSFRQ